MRNKRYADKMQEELQLKGVEFFDPSEDNGSRPTLNIDSNYLELPLHITEVSVKDLGEYLNAYTQQKMYMRTLIGWCELMMEEAKRQYYEASEERYRELSMSKMSETAKEREINSDPDIAPFFHEYVDFKKKMSLLNQNLWSIEDAIFMLSREVSRRSGDFNDENRNHNVGNL